MTIHSDDRDPKQRDILRRADAGMTTSMMAAIAVALMLGLGIVWYMMSDRTNTASVTPPATTGQSAPIPMPTPAPAPERAPAPAPEAK